MTASVQPKVVATNWFLMVVNDPFKEGCMATMVVTFLYKLLLSTLWFLEDVLAFFVFLISAPHVSL